MDPVTCPVCFALTLETEAHAGYHAAVAAADTLVLPDPEQSTVD